MAQRNDSVTGRRFYSGPNAPKADRAKRADKLRERMAATGKSVEERATERGFVHIPRKLRRALYGFGKPIARDKLAQA